MERIPSVEIMREFRVRHATFAAKCSFDEAVRKIKSRLGVHNAAAYQALAGDPARVKEMERIIASQAGTSCLMLFDEFDHGQLLTLRGIKHRALQLVIGNPLIALQMTEQDVRAGLYAPVRLFISENNDGRTCIDFDWPSSLFGQFMNPVIDAVAESLDQKLRLLVDLP